MDTESDEYSSEDALPYVEIVEQPASKALRFRYECEGRSAGCIPGENSCVETKTFPTIKIHNYNGRATTVVSCVTKDRPYRPHPHNLVGKNTSKGVGRADSTPGDSIVSFINLGIQCVKRKHITESLNVREEIRVDPYKTGFDHKNQPAEVDLNSVRLCFQVFIEGKAGKTNVPLEPVVSQPIFDKKATCDLRICELSRFSASVAGGIEIVLLCEKVDRDNVQVRFFENRDGKDIWEGYGDFNSVIDVHKQVAINFCTPAYKHRRIEDPLDIWIQLKRPSDGMTSEPLPFCFLPIGADDPESLKRKRRDFSESPKARVLRIIRAEAENCGRLLNQAASEAVDPVNLKAHVQSFPVGNSIPYRDVQLPTSAVGHCAQSTPSPIMDGFSYKQDSPGSLPSPGLDYASCRIPYISNNQMMNNEHFETIQNNRTCMHHQHPQSVSHHLQCSPYSEYCQQTHRQEASML